MKDSYVNDVEQQNNNLRAKLEEAMANIEVLEKKIEMFDFLPTFSINHNPQSPIPNYTHESFIHQCLQSAYEVLSDMVGDDILTHVERKVVQKKTRKPKMVSKIDLECWYLGSAERRFHVTVYSLPDGRYDVSVEMSNPAGIKPSWDSEEDEMYRAMVPTSLDVRKQILSDLQDCQTLSKYIIDK
jgi:hypothetical protein